MGLWCGVVREGWGGLVVVQQHKTAGTCWTGLYSILGCHMLFVPFTYFGFCLI